METFLTLLQRKSLIEASIAFLEVGQQGKSALNDKLVNALGQLAINEYHFPTTAPPKPAVTVKQPTEPLSKGNRRPSHP